MELSPSELDELGEQVARLINAHLESLGEGRIVPEDLSPGRLRALFAEPLPRQAQGVNAVLEDFASQIAAHSVRIGHPRFFGWIRPSPLAGPIYAEALAAALNQSVAVWDGAPAATEVELRVLEWLKEMSGYTPEAGGLLTSGGSMANFICLLAARSAADPQARELGLAERPPLTVYLTEETHYCVRKAVEMMGLGRRALRYISVDADLRMDPAALQVALRADREAGLRPMAVAATLGTVNSGACDDLKALAEVCRQEAVWLHVDGAYGGLAGLVPEKRNLAEGLAEADSLTIDPHKGLYMPFEAGCALVRNPEHLYAAFAVFADYLPNTELETDAAGLHAASWVDPFAASGEPFHFRDFGPQLSRSFRALKIYLGLKMYGLENITQALARQYSLAQELATRIQASPDLELLAPAPLGIVAFRYCGEAAQPSDQALDELNLRLVGEIQRRGQAFVAGTRLRGRYALRACFVSHRTRESDLDILLEEVRRVGRAL